MAVCLCVHINTAYFVEQGSNRRLVEDDNAWLVLWLPASQKTHIVVISDLDEWEQSLKSILKN